ncbi:MAG: hypothetical protein ACYTGP_06070 [Planctomycetota bacterium]|jgi:hypothetical protein
MRPRKGTTITTYALLCLAGGVSFVMPEAVDHPGPPSATPMPLRTTGLADAPDVPDTLDAPDNAPADPALAEANPIKRPGWNAEVPR